MAKETDASHADDEALSWDGDDKLDAPSLPKGWKAVGKGSEAVETEPLADADAGSEAPAEPVEPAEPKPMSNATLIVLGIFAGAYLLFTIGWIISGLRLQGVGNDLTSGPLSYAIGAFVAAAAPAIWFALSLYITRHAKTWQRILWLLAGLALLVPWPFLMTGVSL